MDVIDKVLRDWSVLCESGIPSKDNPKDLDILDLILRDKYNLDITHKDIFNLNEEEEINSSSPFEEDQYSQLIKKTLVNSGIINEYDSIPLTSKAYTVPIESGALELTKEDAKVFQALYPIYTDKSSGNGEIAIYWLFKYQVGGGYDVKDNRGGDEPDLQIGDSKVEIKSYPSHTARLGLGRWQNDKTHRDIVNKFFGFEALRKGKDQINKIKSDIAFDVKDLVEAIRETQNFLLLDDLADMSAKFPIIRDIQRSLSEIFETLEIGVTESAEDVAGVIYMRILKLKMGNKPGNGNYIANISKKDPKSIYFYKVDFEKIIESGSKMLFDNIAFNAGAIHVNFFNLFS